MRLDPTCNLAYNNRGYLYLMRGQYSRALADLNEAIDLAPRHPNAHKNLAWLMATCPDTAFRDEAKALEHARLALELGGQTEPAWLDILAAAYAESGQFDAAIEWELKALKGNRDPLEVAAYEQRLKLYHEHRPYRAEPLMQG